MHAARWIIALGVVIALPAQRAGAADSRPSVAMLRAYASPPAEVAWADDVEYHVVMSSALGDWRTLTVEDVRRRVGVRRALRTCEQCACFAPVIERLGIRFGVIGAVSQAEPGRAVVTLRLCDGGVEGGRWRREGRDAGQIAGRLTRGFLAPALDEARTAPPLGAPSPEDAPAQIGSLFITTRPGDVEVLVDERFVGHTSGDLLEGRGEGRLRDVVVGRHVITVRKPGFESQKRVVEVREGEITREEITLRAVSSAAQLTVGTSPSGAAIHVDGRVLGLSPAALMLPAGRFEIKVRKRGYRPEKALISLGDGEGRRLFFELERAGGVRVVCLTDAGPWDGVVVTIRRSAGISMWRSRPLGPDGSVAFEDLDAGLYVVTCQPPGGASLMRTISVEAGSVAHVRMNLGARPAVKRNSPTEPRARHHAEDHAQPFPRQPSQPGQPGQPNQSRADDRADPPLDKSADRYRYELVAWTGTVLASLLAITGSAALIKAEDRATEADEAFREYQAATSQIEADRLRAQVAAREDEANDLYAAGGALVGGAALAGAVAVAAFVFMPEQSSAESSPGPTAALGTWRGGATLGVRWSW